MQKAKVNGLDPVTGILRTGQAQAVVYIAQAPTKRTSGRTRFVWFGSVSRVDCLLTLEIG